MRLQYAAGHESDVVFQVMACIAEYTGWLKHTLRMLAQVDGIPHARQSASACVKCFVEVTLIL